MRKAIILALLMIVMTLPSYAQFEVGSRSFSNGSYPKNASVQGSFSGVPLTPSLSIAYSIGASAGSTLLLSFYNDQSVTISSVIDSHSQSFTRLLNLTSGSYNISLWYVLASSSPIGNSDTYTVTAASNISGNHFAYLNSAYTSVASLGATNDSCGSGTSFTDTLTTLANQSTVAMSVFAQESSGTFTLSMTGATQAFSNSNLSTPYWIENENIRTVSTAGSTSATGTFSASVPYCFVSVELRSQ